MKTTGTIKQILVSNGNWWRFYNKHKASIRPSILTNILKLLSCKHVIRGHREYRCSNPDCSHIKYVPHTCKSKACSSCGKKATEVWILKQIEILPETSWQHITFTMPNTLWDFFWKNRFLLNKIGKIAASIIQKIAKKRGVTTGIFIAIHTFGRNLQRNVHIHLSTTTGGISEDKTKWKDVFYDQKTVMRMWRYEIIKLFRKYHKDIGLDIPAKLKKELNHTNTFNHLLDELYKKIWIVHCSKPSTSHKKNVEYLGRYTKRPPIAESKLRHYDGNEVAFKYLDHTTKTYRTISLTNEEFIRRFIQHIPDTGFRMIRYYGFLANRTRGVLLPLVNALLGHNEETNKKGVVTYAQLIKANFNYNPLTCILCGSDLILHAVDYGKSSISNLIKFHRQLSLLKKI